MGFVSEAYCKNAGYTMAEDGVLSLSLNKMPDDFYRIQKDVELNENQSFGNPIGILYYWQRVSPYLQCFVYIHFK